MLDIRYIAGALIVTVAIISAAIRIFGPADTATTATATLKPRIEPSRIVEQATPETKKTTAAPVAPAPKQATAPIPVPGAPKTPIATAPAQATGTQGEVTGSIAEPKPAPKRVVQPRKEETEFQFQWPWLKGWQQN